VKLFWSVHDVFKPESVITKVDRLISQAQ
jgi:hypothetical protein